MARRTVSVGVVLLVLELLINPVVALSQSQPTRTKTLTPDQIADLLRELNGLEAAANIVGKFVINGQDHIWMPARLGPLVGFSPLIVVGRVTARVSHLVHRASPLGDDIYTDYTVEPERIMKGNASGTIVFRVHGGLIKFPPW
jgi:hypothetical protein